MAVAWTAVIILGMSWNFFDSYQNIREYARAQASAAFEKDLVYRRWLARLGGVYVPITEETPPNPYLSYLSERDVTTTTGLKLTLINPAYMTRQVQELGGEQYGYLGHITSSRPIRPENKPDAWENKVLQMFAHGSKEFSEITQIGDKHYLRMMRPMMVEKGCLKCHADQGYQEGEVRGGISVSVPMEPLWTLMYSHQVRVVAGCILVWLMGLAGIGFGALRARQHLYMQDRAKEVLQESEEKFRLAFQTSPDSINLNAIDGTYVEVNEGFCTIMGYRPEEVIGKTSGELHVWKDMTDRKRLLEGLKKNGRVQNLEADFVRKDGSIVTGLMSAVLLNLGDTPLILSITRDITNRVALEREQILLSRAMEQSTDAIVITDTTGIIRYVNPAFERLSGYSKEETIGNNPRMVQSGEHTQDFYQELWETILSGKTWEGQLINRRKNGELYREETSISPVMDKKGALINFVAVKHDVTHKQELKQQLQQAQKLEAVGTLASGIAHDFNNILGAILGYAEMVKGSLTRGSTADQDIDEVIAAGKRATELVKQILAFSRQNSEEFYPVTVQLLLKEVLKLLKATIPSTITLKQHIDPACGPVLGNPTQLHQVILNLCTNAKDALAENKGTITVSLRQRDDHPAREPGRPAAHSASGYLELEVSDTGSGMDNQTLKRIFDPFFTTKAKGQGTGLGLSVSYGIIEQHGGTITATSTPGVGTSFRILLPITTEEQGLVGGLHDAPLPRGQERIVLVDDEEFLVDIAQRTLNDLGYSVTAFTDSTRALTWMKDNPDGFDLLFTDITMPGVTGAELMKNVLSLYPELPVVICTGFSETLTEEQVLALGARAYLPKPVTREQLATTVKQVLHP